MIPFTSSNSSSELSQLNRCPDRRIFFVLFVFIFISHAVITSYLSHNAESATVIKDRQRTRVQENQERLSSSWSPRSLAAIRTVELDRPNELINCKSLNTSRGFLLIVGGNVYSPQKIGQVDILISGGKIIKFLSPMSEESAWLATRTDMVEVLNVTGAIVAPGLVDIHVHVTGGGGEAGPGSRVPEARVSQLLRGGLTTVVGILGMDSITRTPDMLLTKVNALNEGPLTAYMWTGAYSVLPAVPTVTGSLQRDIALLPPCLGVKVAISDHRASQASPEVFRAIAAQATAGGMFGAKRGLVYLHVGAAATRLGPLWDIIKETPIPPAQLLPTHMGRTPELIEDGIAWARAGGAVDVTANSAAPRAVKRYAEAGVLSSVSVSSDAFGSLPKFDSDRRLIGYSYAKPDRLLKFLRAMVISEGWALQRVLPLVTEVPARRVGLRKGTLEPGGDSDLLILDPAGLEVRYVVAKGKIALSESARPGRCVDHDMFEGSTSPAGG